MNSVEDYVRSVLKALIYIERHLDEELTMEGIAKIACYSPYHFHRIFHGVIGESLYQHVKRLRLERAADTLRNTDQPVTQIALEANVTIHLHPLLKLLNRSWEHRRKTFGTMTQGWK